MIHQIEFENYKGFKRRQKLELRPITILIGKNNSGKSAVLRLVEMLVRSLYLSYNEPEIPLCLRTDNFNSNFDFDFGYNFLDLVYKKNTNPLSFSIYSDSFTLHTDIRYYSEVKKPVIEKYSLIANGDEFKAELDANALDNLSEVVHHITINNIQKTNQKNIFNRLNLDWDDGNRKIVEPSGYNKIEVEYLPPLRPAIKRDLSLNEKSRENETPIMLFRDQELMEKVSTWFRENMGVERISADREGQTHIFNINVQLKNTSNTIHISDTGKGIEQSLSIVANSLLYRANTIDIVEQPELHLHPAPQAAIGQLFAESAKRCPYSKFLIETHSENLLLRLRRLVAEGFLQPSDIAIYSVEYDENTEASELKLINVDEWGNVDYWPEGVFAENFEEVRALREAQRKKIEKI